MSSGHAVKQLSQLTLSLNRNGCIVTHEDNGHCIRELNSLHKIAVDEVAEHRRWI